VKSHIKNIYGEAERKFKADAIKAAKEKSPCSWGHERLMAVRRIYGLKVLPRGSEPPQNSDNFFFRGLDGVAFEFTFSFA